MFSISIFYILLTSLISTLVLIPPISKLAVTFGMLDYPDERKVHINGTPRLGGIALFFSFIWSLFLFCELDRQMRGFLVGAVIIFITGLYDDIVGIQPGKKLTGQFLAALAVVGIGNMRLHDLGNLFGTGDIQLGGFAIPFTVMAIVGVTNAVNLLDGLDGLAAGVSAIAAIVMGILAYATGNTRILCMTAALIGALFGFLKYNTYPAQIFMGDSGSMMLGFCLAFFSIMLCTGSNKPVEEVTPLIVLAVPIVDTFIVMVKRFRTSQSLFAPDNSHIHHHLLGIGFGHKGTVIIIYCLSYLLAIVAVGCLRLPAYVQTVILLLVVILLSLLRFTGTSHFNRIAELINNQSLRDTGAYRRLVAFSQNLIAPAKYLVIILLSLTLVVPVAPVREMAIIAAFLAALSLALVFLTNDWGNRFLLFILCFDGAFLVYQIENNGRQPFWGEISPNVISNGLFLSLMVLCVIKFAIRRRTDPLIMGSPLEYLLLFILVSVPLLPQEFTGNHHLLIVSAKSVILFAAYRIILMQQAKHNRKIIVVTMVALVVVALHGIL